MTRKILVLVMLLGGFSQVHGASEVSPGAAAVGDRQAIVSAAEALLKKFWPSLEQDRSSYGLLPGDTLETLSFGAPVQLQGIRDESVRSYQAGQPVTKLVEPTGHWFVPLISQGSYRAMVEVLDQGQSHWQGSGIGWVPLAKKWQAISRRWPASGQDGPLLVIVFSQPGYYLSVSSVQPANLTALAALKLGDDGSVPADFQLDEANRIVDRLKSAIETQPKN